MSRLKLLTLWLENFQGATEELSFDGQSAVIKGWNGFGKSRRMSAYTWLVTGKDNVGRAQGNFEIKNLDADNEAAHNLEHTVGAVFDLDGRRLELRKTMAEVWTRKRGNSELEFTGHEVRHFLDGVPVLKKEFDARVAEIAPENLFRLLTDPAAFHQLHWEDRRAKLLEVCGDVSDADVIDGNPALAELPEILDGRTHKQHRDLVKGRRAEINKELTVLPARIDEATKAMPLVDEALKPSLEGKLASLREQRSALEQRRAQVTAGGAVAELQVEIRTQEAALAGVVQRVRSSAETALASARRDRDAAQDAVSQARREVDRLTTDATATRQAITNADAEIERLRTEWRRIDSSEPPHSDVPSSCAACGQALPAHKVSEAQERALAAWNIDKALRLELNQAAGTQLRSGIDTQQAKLATLEEQKDAAAQRLMATESLATEALATVDRLTAALPDPAADQEHQAITNRIAELRVKVEAAKASTTDAAAALHREVAGIEDQMRAVEADLAAYGHAERSKARVAELDAQQKRLAAEFEELERQLDLLDLFTKEKAALLNDRINSRFQITKWRLFKQQINGGLEPDCTALVGGVPYDGGLNEAGRINSGLDVIKVLQAHHGFHPPVWVDGCESILEPLPLDTQVIRLNVAPQMHLSLELEEPAVEAVA